MSRGLCIGINYPGSVNQLQGCINDAHSLKNCLIVNNIAAPDNIRVLENPDGRSIMSALATLARQTHEEHLKFVFISYSGHGGQIADRNGDEADGLDEIIFPVDFEQHGVITDDMLKSTLSLCDPECTVSFVCDACRSGSMLDLRYCYDSKTHTQIASSQCPSRIVMISGCQDNQTSADAFDQETNAFAGAMTCALLYSLRRVPEARADIFVLLQSMKQYLKNLGFSQIPVLSSSFELEDGFSFIPGFKL